LCLVFVENYSIYELRLTNDRHEFHHGKARRITEVKDKEKEERHWTQINADLRD